MWTACSRVFSLKLALPIDDKYERTLTNMRVVLPSLTLQAYKNIHNSTGQQVTSRANTHISAIFDHAF